MENPLGTRRGAGARARVFNGLTNNRSRARARERPREGDSAAATRVRVQQQQHGTRTGCFLAALHTPRRVHRRAERMHVPGTTRPTEHMGSIALSCSTPHICMRRQEPEPEPEPDAYILSFPFQNWKQNMHKLTM